MTSPERPKASDCLDYLRAYEAKHHMPPTIRDIMVAMGLKSTSGVVRVLDVLKARGLIKVKSGKIRGIEIVERKCPNCGHDLNSSAGSKTAVEAPGDSTHPPMQPVAGGTF